MKKDVGILYDALEKISKIELKEFGADWEEIEEAQDIANEAMIEFGKSDTNKKPTIEEFSYAIAVAIWKKNDLYYPNGDMYYENEIAKMIENAMIEVYGKDL